MQVYEAFKLMKTRSCWSLLLCAGLLCLGAAPVQAQQSDELLAKAAKAMRGKDRKALASFREVAIEQQHALASWIAYWDIGLRLGEATQADLDAFYARWAGTYVEDRLRNDWLLELGKRRDWKNLAADYPRFRMNDDREVTCYALLTQHLAGSDVAAAARSAWWAQRDKDDGCNLLASTLYEARQLSSADVWMKLRLATESRRPNAAQQAAALLGKATERALSEINDKPARFLAAKSGAKSGKLGRSEAELVTLALSRLSISDPESAAALLSSRLENRLPADLNAWAWSQAGMQAALKLMPEASSYFENALEAQSTLGNKAPEWSNETLAWLVRSALRAEQGGSRWPLVLRGIELMGDAYENDSAWVYWRARALLATAGAGATGEAQRNLAQQLLARIASPLNFYGKLAQEALAIHPVLPASPAPLSTAERAAAAGTPGLTRGLALIKEGLRSEGVREWNFTLRGMNDRQLLAAAQLACDMEVWDRCINASDRTKGEIDMAQRFPTPYRSAVMDKSREIGLDPAYVYGLIRQESRFIMDAQSHVGATGLMQVMPSTARWVAKRIGINYSPSALSDRDFNLRLGTHYLKLVLDDFGGSMAMGAAAYNAGPSRPRRWREGPVLEAAIWAENIPFNETRDYVKKVLSNTVIYSAVLTGQAHSLRSQLGTQIGPRSGAPEDKELP